jgi:uncharacterized OB-fold protein
MKPSTPRQPAPGALPRDWAVPAIDRTNRAWFTAGALALQECAACHRLQHPPEEICHECGSMEFVTRTVAPTGTVHSYTIVHHAVHPALESSVPYTVVLVALDDVPPVRVVGNLLDVAPGEVKIGLPVEAVWEERPTEDDAVVLLPQWRRRRSR